MLISFQCSQCGKTAEADAAAAGTRTVCPHCQAGVEVPQKPIGPGVTLGGFRINQLIGEGGMGQVYLALQLSLDRPVALKILPEAVAVDPAKAQRFINEVHMLARLEHAHIVTAHEAGEDGGVLFMAMAYVKGESLDHRLQRDGPIPEKDALRIVAKVAAALAYAWNEHHLLHRDIKPSNILLDTKGEPKLADLGLSLTAEMQAAGTEDAEFVVGTPNYMSPEQAEGREADCRSDMYSLGATLHHMLTGVVPFAGADPAEVLRRQVTEKLPDVRTARPEVSLSCDVLLKRMLAKNPAARYPNWEALIGDLERVRRGKAPTGKPLGRNDSLTMRAGDVSALARASHAAPPRHVRVGALLGVVLFAALGAFVVIRTARERGAAPAPRPAPPGPQTPDGRDLPDAGREQREALARQVEELEAFCAAHPEAFDETLARAGALRQPAAGTPLAGRVKAVHAQAAERRRRAVAQAAAALRVEVADLVGRGDLEGAASAAGAEPGRFAEELAELRAALLGDIARRRREAEEAVRAREEAARAAEAETLLAALHGQLAADLLRQDFPAARALLEQAAADEALSPAADRVAGLAEEVKAVARLPEAVMAGVAADAGRTVTLALTTGAETWEIGDVQGHVIHARKTFEAGLVARDIGYDELAVAERFRRLGADPAPDRCIMRGLLAWQAQRPTVAAQQFEAGGTPLGAALAAALNRWQREAAEAEAAKAYDVLLRLAGQAPGGPPEAVAKAVRTTPYPPPAVPPLRAAAAAFREQYAATAFGASVAVAVEAMEKAANVPLEIEAGRLERAMAQLREVNPQAGELQANVQPTDNGIEINLAGNRELTDLRPLAGLPITGLNLSGTGVRDLEPLSGMPLERLDLGQTPVRELTALRGVPLRDLNLSGTAVQTLGALRGAPLGRLDLSDTRVTALTPLVGAPLRDLCVAGCPITSLRALEGFPLERLDLSRCQDVEDLKPLKGIPLRELILNGSAVSDLAPLADTRLEALELAACMNLRDLAPLKGLPLRKLNLQATSISDLGPLAGMPLERLELVNMPRLGDLGPLAGLPLRYLWLYGSGVSDIGPLAGCPLLQLDLRHTRVSNLDPCAKMPLQILFLEGCGEVGDLQVLNQCLQLRVLVLPSRRIPMDVLRGHPAIQELGFSVENLRPAEEFWRMVGPRPERPRRVAPGRPRA